MGICYYGEVSLEKGWVRLAVTYPTRTRSTPNLGSKVLTWTYLGPYQSPNTEGFSTPHLPCIADSEGRLNPIRPIRCGEVWVALEF